MRNPEHFTTRGSSSEGFEDRHLNSRLLFLVTWLSSLRRAAQVQFIDIALVPGDKPAFHKP